MSPREIENAIRQLPISEARELLQRLEDLRLPVQGSFQPSEEVIAKWQVKHGFSMGLTTEQYLNLVRDGGRD
jgi:hypothetical protein